MPFPLGAAIGGGAGLLGDIFGFASAKNLSSTAHQREVADLRKAGLNPVLSAMGGPGASTPNVPDFGGVAQDMVHSARNAKEMKLLDQQIAREHTALEKEGYEASFAKEQYQGGYWRKQYDMQTAATAASARSLAAGAPWKEAVGTVAKDAADLYRRGQRFIRRGVQDFRELPPRRMPGRGRIPAFRNPFRRPN